MPAPLSETENEFKGHKTDLRDWGSEGPQLGQA